MERTRRKTNLSLWVTMTMLVWLLVQVYCKHEGEAENSDSKAPVVLTPGEKNVTIDNGLFQVTLSKPEGLVTGIKYNGIDNVLTNTGDQGYWDIVWYEPTQSNQIDKIRGTHYNVITETEDLVEISFSKNWTTELRGRNVPLNIDKRYIVRRGMSGIYMYSIMERLSQWPEVNMDQIRIVFKLNQKKFHYMAVSDDRQRVMPSAADRAVGRGEPLAYKEAVLLINPDDPELRGEVDDKYQYSCEDKDNKVHGWISDKPSTGFWMITPTDEYRMAGPVKQDLTSHVGPTTLSSFTSTHYVGMELNTTYVVGESWKKVFGPVLVYLNSASTRVDLWTDAKRQMTAEVNSWPYNFTKSDDFPSANQRGNVVGQLMIQDGKTYTKGNNAFVGLALPGDVGSWQKEIKGYQFWTETFENGYFVIKNVRPGTYNLYGFVNGFIGDYKYEENITVTPGGQVQLGMVVYKAPRNGPTMWEIGVPNRRADEFYIPDPYPTLMNKLFINYPHKFRQYGLWQKYSDLYRNEDLVFTIGSSNYTTDWFYAQVTRNLGNKIYAGTTWQVVFNLTYVNTEKNYTLQLALAGATMGQLKVNFNKIDLRKPDFETPVIGKDNAIARHGIHGLYRLYTIVVPGSKLVVGKNTIFLSQTRNGSPFFGVMYDYLRLEGPME